MSSEILQMQACNVCQNRLGEPAYVSPRDVSVTSLRQICPLKTSVYFCQRCGHLKTQELQRLDDYYDTEFKILIESEKEDQLYSMSGDRKVFRSEHQVETLLNKIDIPEGARVLDYGCAKGAVLKQFIARRPDIKPYLFEVSEMYLPFWKKFATSDSWATYEPKESWRESLDLVTAFFMLEHVAEPLSVLKTVAGLLRQGGYFYFIVPNVYANIGDFVVVEHVNHFSVLSLQYLLSHAGFSVVEIDDSAHQSAFVVVAKKTKSPNPIQGDSAAVKAVEKQVNRISDYWKSFAEKIQAFEKEHSSSKEVAIYGGGFYGTFIASCLNRLDKVQCFADQNPYLQGKTLLDKPIVSPDDLPKHVNTIYVGLNPAIARREIQKVTSWADRGHKYFYP